LKTTSKKCLKTLDFSRLVEPVAVCLGYRIQFATTRRRILNDGKQR
jgi:hypothetical protein